MIEAGASAVSRCLGASKLYPPMTEEEFATQVYLAMRDAIKFSLDRELSEYEKALHAYRRAGGD